MDRIGTRTMVYILIRLMALLNVVDAAADSIINMTDNTSKVYPKEPLTRTGYTLQV